MPMLRASVHATLSSVKLGRRNAAHRKCLQISCRRGAADGIFRGMPALRGFMRNTPYIRQPVRLWGDAYNDACFRDHHGACFSSIKYRVDMAARASHRSGRDWAHASTLKATLRRLLTDASRNHVGNYVRWSLLGIRALSDAAGSISEKRADAQHRHNTDAEMKGTYMTALHWPNILSRKIVYFRRAKSRKSAPRECLLDESHRGMDWHSA